MGTVKREVDDVTFPDVPPGFLAADSIPATVKNEADADVGSAVDDIDQLPLKERMRMLPVGGSSSGTESSRRVPTRCVDVAVVEEARPLKSAARGALPAVADRAYIRSESGARLVAIGASSMNDPSRLRMGPKRCSDGASSSRSSVLADDCVISLSDDRHICRARRVPEDFRWRGVWLEINGWQSRLTLADWELLDQTPFAGLLRMHMHVHTRRLILALIERWRPETHTFHLPFCEWGITPGDIFVHTGLPVRGDALPYARKLEPLPLADIVRLIGEVPPPHLWQGHAIRATWIFDTFSSMVVLTTEDRVRRIRALVWYYLGTTVFCLGNDAIHTGFLRLLEDLPATRSYAWGLGLLSHLFTGLDDVAGGSGRSVTGFWPLLEVLFYDYFPSLAPPRLSRQHVRPRMQMWLGGNLDRPVSAAVDDWRSQLDNLSEAALHACPYYDDVRDDDDALVALGLSMRRMIMSSPRSLEWYLGERLTIQLGHHRPFLVPCSPPLMLIRRATMRPAQIVVGLAGYDLDHQVREDRSYDEWYAQYGRRRLWDKVHVARTGHVYGGGGALRYCPRDSTTAPSGAQAADDREEESEVDEEDEG